MLCCYCARPFTSKEFQYHVCVYNSDDDDNAVAGNNNIVDKKSTNNVFDKCVDNNKNDHQSITDNKLLCQKNITNDEENNHNFNRCLKIIQDNQIRIKKLLKDCFKININQIINLTSQQQTTIDGDTVVLSTTKVKESKKMITKSAGPHECTLCDRKFVHASGLSKHMEKHEQDRYQISGSYGEHRQNNPETETFAIVYKCTICNRNFSSFDEVVKHVKFAHSKLLDDNLSDENIVEDEFAGLLDLYNDHIDADCDLYQKIVSLFDCFIYECD